MFDNEKFLNGFLEGIVFAEPVYFDEKFGNIPNLTKVNDTLYWLEDARDAFSIKDFSPESRECLDDLCSRFLLAADKYVPLFEGCEEDAGIDFYLTLVGHGAGFWDDSRKYEGKGKEITEIVHDTFPFAEINLFSPDGHTLIVE